MTEAGKHRKAARKIAQKQILAYLTTRSAMRFYSTPGRLRAAAKQIAMNLSAAHRRSALAA